MRTKLRHTRALFTKWGAILYNDVKGNVAAPILRKIMGNNTYKIHLWNFYEIFQSILQSTPPHNFSVNLRLFPHTSSDIILIFLAQETNDRPLGSLQS